MSSSGEWSGSESGRASSRSPTITITKNYSHVHSGDLEFPVPPRRGSKEGGGASRECRMSTGSRTNQPEERLLSVRRSNHRDYEQRRRNSIKEQFDGLRSCIPNLKNTTSHVSKQRILREAHDHIAILISRADSERTLSLERTLSEQQLRRMALSRDCDEAKTRIEALKSAKGIRFEAQPNLLDSDGNMTDKGTAFINTAPMPDSLRPDSPNMSQGNQGNMFRPQNNVTATVKVERDAYATTHTPPSSNEIHQGIVSIVKAACT